MNDVRALTAAVLLASLAALPVAGQMHGPGDMSGMGGARHMSINLVSPPGAAAQLGRGMLVIGQPMGMMMMQHNGSAGQSLVLLLRLAGVSDAHGLLTNSHNHFVFDGRLASATGEVQVPVDEQFTLQNGAALLRVEVPLGTLSQPARLLIDRIEVSDDGGETFAVPGVAISRAAPASTPRPTPHSGCQSAAECDDDDPNTQDLCMPMGCVHRPTHMGGGMMH